MLGDPKSARGGVTGRRVLECLQDQLPTIAEPGYKFAQDNASTHTCRLVQDWLRNWAAENGVELVDWPAYSPDLNPIENLWKLIKEDITKRHPELAGMTSNNQAKQRLCEAAIESWEQLEDDLLNKLIDSMPRRIAAVVSARGWYTKY